MKKSLYQVFVYITLTLSLVSLVFFIFELATSNEMNKWAILCLVLTIVGLVLFVLNQILYRQFKIRDASRYEQVECPHCHTLNSKKELFCKNCGKNLYK